MLWIFQNLLSHEIKLLIILKHNNKVNICSKSKLIRKLELFIFENNFYSKLLTAISHNVSLQIVRLRLIIKEENLKKFKEEARNFSILNFQKQIIVEFYDKFIRQL